MIPDLSQILDEAVQSPASLTTERIAFLLALRGEEAHLMRRMAYEVKCRILGKVVYFRGIVELSNQCGKNCFYCGIRRDNREVFRYLMPPEEVLAGAEFAWRSGYGSMVLQSGEIQSEKFTDYVESLVQEIKAFSGGELGITLSLGEQTAETFARWKSAGAHRYLLRVETSDPALYGQIHPQDSRHTFAARMASLEALKRGGWQTGSGILIGFPGQDELSLANDLLFLRDFDVDMIGMGPFIPHHQTPLAEAPFDPVLQMERGLNMIACARLLMPEINIASTTALQALSPEGRERGILSGANIIMPNLSETKYRASYQLYEGKPALNENAESSRNALQKSIESIGETLGLNEWGDSLHFHNRQKK